MHYLTTIHLRLGENFHKHPHLNLGGTNDIHNATITSGHGHTIEINRRNIAPGYSVHIRLHIDGIMVASATLWDRHEAALVDAAVMTAQHMIDSLQVTA